MSQRSISTICLGILTTGLIFIVLHLAKAIFAPIISALLLGVILTPLTDFWDRLRIPSALSATLSVLLALSTILILALFLEPYVTEVISKAPLIWDELSGTLEELRRALQGFEKITEDMTAAMATDALDGESGVALPTITDTLFFVPQFAGQILIFTGTLYFFLMVKNDLYDWVSDTTFQFDHEDLRLAGQQVSRYVLTISAINLGLGCVVAVVMTLLGMPSPVLWGLLAFALNFLLYLGPIALLGMLTITGIVVFDGATSFFPAIIYLLLNMSEAQFVTPTLVGKSLSVNPLTVFLSLVFWLWLWGPIGGIIAIPLLIWGVTIYERIMKHRSQSNIAIVLES